MQPEIDYGIFSTFKEVDDVGERYSQIVLSKKINTL
jgi:hypothetical protein